MHEPKRIWWARPRKLCALERPGGGGRSHRTERRTADIEYLRARGVRTVISVMGTRHNLASYDAVGLDWYHVPVERTEDGADALEELLALLRRETRYRGQWPFTATATPTSWPRCVPRTCTSCAESIPPSHWRRRPRRA